MIKRPTIVVVLVALLASCQPQPAPLQAITSSGTLQTLDGEALSNHILLLNFWAPWCKPCLQEIPELNQFATSHPGVVLLAVNFDHPTQDKVSAIAQQAGIHYASLVTDPATRFSLPEIPGLPVTLLINERGEIVKTLLGPQTQLTLATALQEATSPPRAH